jgi:hypothetical protein
MPQQKPFNGDPSPDVAVAHLRNRTKAITDRTAAGSFWTPADLVAVAVVIRTLDKIVGAVDGLERVTKKVHEEIARREAEAQQQE